MFILYEVYDNEPAFDAHRQTQHYAEFSSAVEIMTVEKSVRTYIKL